MRWIRWNPQFWRDRALDIPTFGRFALRRFLGDRCPQAAAALTYTALLAIVPLTTIMVGIISAFPAFRDMQIGFRELVVDNFVPQVGESVLDNLSGFASNAGRLTGFGLVGLIITSILLLSTIEGAFNTIWRVRENRPVLVRLLSFWAILSLTPILVVASVSATTELFNANGVSSALGSVRGMTPPLVEFIGLSLLYWLIPNRAVRGVDAMLGGGVATILFEVAKGAFTWYLTAFPVYQTIYGALATVPIFLIWLYLTWSIVLLGAVIAAALPDWRAGKLIGGEADSLLPALRLTLACAVLRVLAEASRFGTKLSRKTLLNRVPVGGAMLDGILDQLRHARFVERAANDSWILSRDLHTASLYDLAKGLGIGLRGAHGAIRGLDGPWQSRLSELITAADAAQTDIMGLPLMEVLEPEPINAPSPNPLPRRGEGYQLHPLPSVGEGGTREAGG
ncbi:YihY family inner membrane protein [Inquilinus sp. CAU 1745]|uniref:YihY family inner membrane protein n=1 Tax=Inquilinus sp. CAU 1745 TaxID=3140369 RepID=UPI00325B2635